MMKEISSPHIGRMVLAGVGLTLLFAVLVWQAGTWQRDAALADLQDSNAYQLNLYVAHLEGQLSKYEYLPELLSSDSHLVQVLLHPDDQRLLDDLNRRLETINSITGTSDIYLMNAAGLTVAASNWNSPHPFIGRNFSFRPYFQDAMKGGLGRYFALGSTSQKRGYYFAYPVRHEGKVLGVTVVKVDISAVEKHWSGHGHQVMVVDPDGVAFITTRDEWRYRTLTSLDYTARERIHASKRYPNIQLQTMPIREIRRLSADSRLWEIRCREIDSEQPETCTYLVQIQSMPMAGWKVYLLTPLDQVERWVLSFYLIAGMSWFAILLIGFILFQRHKRRQDRARYESHEQAALREAHDQLERRVQERTAELLQEVERHRLTAEKLRKTQNELIQAAKLAVLGQLAAGISHELNQPLAAIRVYADTGRLLLERERFDELRDNLARIGQMTERMGHISSQLREFVRKTSGDLTAVNLLDVLETSRIILHPRLKHSSTELHLEVDEGIRVMANRVQLEQVMVNLIDNAINAMEGVEQPRIHIHAEVTDGQVRITIRDNGPGIPDENLEQIFEPFFTTRETGLGLGLSISQRIVHGMGGSLSAGNHAEGGAEFTLILEASPD